jgi:hypothetical protein
MLELFLGFLLVGVIASIITAIMDAFNEEKTARKTVTVNYY